MVSAMLTTKAVPELGNRIGSLVILMRPADLVAYFATTFELSAAWLNARFGNYFLLGYFLVVARFENVCLKHCALINEKYIFSA